MIDIYHNGINVNKKASLKNMNIQHGTYIISRDKDDDSYKSLNELIDDLLEIKTQIESEGKKTDSVYLIGAIGIRWKKEN